MANSTPEFESTKISGSNSVQILPGGIYSREDDAMDLKRILGTVFAWRKIILGATALSGLLAILYLTFAKPTYVATAQLMIESRQPKIISGDDIAPGLNTGRYIIGQVIESQLQLLRSPRIAERVIRRLKQPKPVKPVLVPGKGLAEGKATPPTDLIGGLKKDSTKSSPPKSADSGPGDVTPEIEVTQAEISKFLRNLDVRRIGQSLIIQVSYSHEKAKMAARIANYITSSYLAQQQESRGKRNFEVRQWLKARVVELQSSIRSSQRNIETYKARHDLIDTGGQLLSERELAETIKQSIEAKANAEAILARISQSERTKIADKKDSSGGLTIKSNVIDELKQQYSQVNRKLATAVSKYGQNHPSVYTFRAELANLKQEIEREGTSLIHNLRNDYKVAQGRAELLNKRVQALNEKLTSGRKLTIRLAEMQYEAKVNNNLYELLLSKLRETELRASLQRADSRIVRRAKAPQKPSHPRKLLTLAGSLMAGFALSFSFALLGEFMGNVIRNVSDVRRYLDFNKVVELPLLGGNSRNASGDETRELFAGHSMKQRSSEYEQQIFLLNEFLRKKKPEGSGQVVAFISALDGEGKTVTAVNLANYTASIGVRTLLIDCDLHEADATTILRPQPKLSLIDIINGGKEMNDVVVVDETTGLSICPAVLSPSPLRPMDILASTKMGVFLREAKEQFQLIILDTPALGRFVDARTLVDDADSIVMVLEADRASAATIKETIEPISEHKSKIHAVALNKIPARPGLSSFLNSHLKIR